jgi:hypothetical protein
LEAWSQDTGLAVLVWSFGLRTANFSVKEKDEAGLARVCGMRIRRMPSFSDLLESEGFFVAATFKLRRAS